MADYEDGEEEVEIEELNDFDFAEEQGDSVACVVQILLCNQMALDTTQRYQIFLFKVLGQERGIQPHH